jgi:hypothetical protein
VASLPTLEHPVPFSIVGSATPELENAVVKEIVFETQLLARLPAEQGLLAN